MHTLHTLHKLPPSDAIADHQAARIRRLAALLTPGEVLAARRRIKPALWRTMSETDLHELALTLAYAEKQHSERDSIRPIPTDSDSRPPKGKGDNY